MAATCKPGKAAAGKKLAKLKRKAGRLCIIIISPSPAMLTLLLLLPFLV